MRVLASTTLVLILGCSSNGAGQQLQPAPGTDGPVAAQTAQAAPDSALPRLTADIAQPYFADGVAAEASARFALEDWSGARARFRRYLADTDDSTLDESQRARVRLMIALCDAKLRNWADAAKGFDVAASAMPLLADFAHYNAARAYYNARDVVAAERHARAVSAESRMSAEAQLLVGDILRSHSDFAAMAEHYESYLADRTRGPRLAESTYRLAQAYERTDRIPDAVARYHRIPIFYYKSMRNPKAVADFAAALKAPGLTAEAACVAAYHRAQSWWKERNRTRSAPLFEVAIELCAKTTNTELKVKSAYMGGRSYARLNKHTKAIALYAQVEAFDHSYADDARMRQAEEYRELGNEDKVGELLGSLPDQYPEGDMRAEATWRLAWRAYKAKDYKETIRWLRKQIEVMPIDQRWYGEGQAQYWMGRSYAKLGKTDESIAAYEKCVRLYPLSYYALLALNRLREKHTESFEALRADIARAPEDTDVGALEFMPRALYAEPGFLRGIEMLKLGLGRDASIELARVGLKAPSGRKQVTDADEVDRTWAMAWLFDRAGRYDLSHWVTRWHVLGYKRYWPTGHWRQRWRIAYPMAYSHLIEAAAKRHGYPAALQMAIMREESAFDPLRESYANAIGLTQMIFSTGRRFAKGTGIEATRENLRDPAKNVIIGSNFLAFLHRTFEGRAGLMIPSYNAGEGATWRWMWARHSPGWERDEWEEEIPGDQARNYTKRVLASYFTYAYLADGTIPEMRQEVPVRLVPDRKIKQYKRRAKRRKR